MLCKKIVNLLRKTNDYVPESEFDIVNDFLLEYCQVFGNI